MVGFFIIVSPFIIRSIILANEPLFSLQQKIDIIKGINITHDGLYKTFIKPPDVLTTILVNKSVFIARFLDIITATFTYIFNLNNLHFLIGLPFFLFNYKKSFRFVLCYYSFLIIHIIFISNYLETSDIPRVYTSMLTFSLVIGSIGFFTTLLKLIENIQVQKYQNSCILFIMVLIVFLSINNTLNKKLNFDENGPLSDNVPRSDFPEPVIKFIQSMEPMCLYSNTSQTAWELDLPTIIPPLNLDEIFLNGPKTCNYFLNVDYGNNRFFDFLEKNGILLYQYRGYSIYKLNY